MYLRAVCRLLRRTIIWVFLLLMQEHVLVLEETNACSHKRSDDNNPEPPRNAALAPVVEPTAFAPFRLRACHSIEVHLALFALQVALNIAVFVPSVAASRKARGAFDHAAAR